MNMPELPNLPTYEHYETLGIYDLEAIHTFLGEEGLQTIIDENGNRHKINLNTRRLNTFIGNLDCLCCGAKGEFWMLQINHAPESREEGYDQPHLNLYARCPVSGNSILMTSDYIIPRAHGGKDTMGNRQPLCVRCNKIKLDRTDITFDHIRARIFEPPSQGWYQARANWLRSLLKTHEERLSVGDMKIRYEQGKEKLMELEKLGLIKMVIIPQERAAPEIWAIITQEGFSLLHRHES